MRPKIKVGNIQRWMQTWLILLGQGGCSLKCSSKYRCCIAGTIKRKGRIETGNAVSCKSQMLKRSTVRQRLFFVKAQGLVMVSQSCANACNVSLVTSVLYSFLVSFPYSSSSVTVWLQTNVNKSSNTEVSSTIL
jgi:hypothetical protein